MTKLAIVACRADPQAGDECHLSAKVEMMMGSIELPDGFSPKAPTWRAKCQFWMTSALYTGVLVERIDGLQCNLS